jgi:hypothetical protein
MQDAQIDSEQERATRRAAWLHRLDAIADRLLRTTGDDAPHVARSKLRSYGRFLGLLVATEAWHALHYPAYRENVALHVAIALVLSTCAALLFWKPAERAAALVAVAALFVDLVSVFPENANHQYLGLVTMGLLALPRREGGREAGPADPEAREARLVLQALRWLIPIGFFWAGVQKAFHGYWFGGEFLAVRIATDPTFANALGVFLSSDELARLTSLVPGYGVGPYRVDEPLFRLLSNGTWIAELALAPLLLVPRTRLFAATSVVLFLLVVELAARELFFGLTMTALALLYTRGDANRIALPCFAAVLFYLLATSAGWLPGFSFG